MIWEGESEGWKGEPSCQLALCLCHQGKAEEAYAMEVAA